jgi:hypothetical protein
MGTVSDRIEKKVTLHAPIARIWRAISNSSTLLTITESGFDRIPLERRAKAFTANEGGWDHQAKLIEKYLQRHHAA